MTIPNSWDVEEIPEHLREYFEPLVNNHPTVKPQKLINYLARLVTPPGGVVLDMFGGSGTTALACIEEGFNYLLIEQSPEYVEIARARAAHAERQKLMEAG